MVAPTEMLTWLPSATVVASVASVCVPKVLVAGSYGISIYGCACVSSLRDLALGAVAEVLYVVSPISLIDRLVVVGTVALGGGAAAVLVFKSIDLSPAQIFKVVRSRPRMQPNRGDQQYAEA